MGNVWYDRAKASITLVIERAKAEGITDVEEWYRRATAAYPFGVREYTPYKQWLKARREIFTLYGRKPTSESQKLEAWDAAAKEWTR